ncbi:exo-alpha-sialidase [Prolixibacteraceae bacterium JC049]|nr:exo-alpha-sialidase [Prolixibacteraceae bacterium JC049]
MRTVIGLMLLLLTGVTVAQNSEFKVAKGVKSNIDLFNAEMRPGVSCYRIPALVTAPNGDLIAAIDERVPSCGDLKWSKNINIVIRRSSVNGKSWLPIETVVDFPLGQSASDPSLIVDRETKEIFMFYNFMDLDKEKDIYYLHVVSSKDNGKTWSEPRDITHQIALPGWKKDFKFITSGRGVQLENGTMLHCLVNLKTGGHIFGSDDHGKNWYLINKAIKPFNESKIIELTNGDWMINSRVQGLGYRYVHISKDNGASWHSFGDTTLIDPACNASIIRYTSKKDGYKKNRLLFANAKRVKGRMNMTVRISYDEGKTWSDGKTVYAGSSAYSTLTILKNGDIGLLFEKDDYKSNQFVSFSLKWLTDGKDKLRKR